MTLVLNDVFNESFRHKSNWFYTAPVWTQCVHLFHRITEIKNENNDEDSH